MHKGEAGSVEVLEMWDPQAISCKNLEDRWWNFCVNITSAQM